MSTPMTASGAPVGSAFFMLLLLFALPASKASPEGKQPVHPITGGCQWGKVRYKIPEEPQSVYPCHCLDCQRLTSSAFSLGIVVSERGFLLSGVEPRQLQRTADSGRVNVRLVCPECGSWICGTPRDGAIRIRAGSL